MSALRDTGWAKLNLSLEVLGRRTDGFHEIRSVVAFARLGDEVALEPGDGLGLEIEGPFAGALGGDNLIVKAASLAAVRVPGLTLGRFRLRKLLPVAAGLGGGSADAAAALRLIACANAGRLEEPLLAGLAQEIGSDVSVCLASRPALVTGRGEHIMLAGGFPACGVLLANPRLPLATEAVYAALRAQAFTPPEHQQEEAIDFGGDFAALVDYARSRRNDLEGPAARLVPEIREVLASLLALRAVRLARMSGSGPTCFGLFATEDEATRAQAELAAQHPNWWIAATALRS